MIDVVKFKKRLRKSTTANVKSVLLFLQSSDPVTFNDIAKVVKASGEVKDLGRAVGGILSTLSRTIFDDEPFIIPVGRESKGSRRLLWKFNPSVIKKDEQKQKLILIAEQVIKERQ